MKLTNTGKISTKWIIALSIIAVFLLGMAALVAVVTTPGRQVRAEIARIKAAGEPTTMQDLAGPSIPPDENAATIYAKVFAAMPAKSSADEKAIDAVASSDPPVTPKQLADARAAFVRHKNVIPLVEQATARSICRFPVQWQQGINTLFPHYAKLRNVSRFLSAGAVLAAHDGNLGESTRLLDLGVKISSSTKDEPTLISFLVRIAMLKIGTHAIRDVMNCSSLTDAQAMQLSHTLQTIDLSQGMTNAFQGERAMQIWTYDMLQHDPASLGYTIPGIRGKGNPLVSIWINYDERYCLQQMQGYIAHAREPYYELKKHNPSLLTDPNPPKYAILSALLLPVCSRTCIARDLTEAELRGCRIALALHIYHNRFNSYPASLNELKTKLAMPIPTDPFSGKPFIYKPAKNGYLIYSIGANLRDDGGVAPLKNKDQTMTGDIVWKVR